ncbi:MAG: toxin-antitoxin system HicB family antitoxin, partial [Rhizobiaceae bacterium]|nr:toxin-antitoxin system HicB family antitoxin [Rhizobiaceae bacterium]
MNAVTIQIPDDVHESVKAIAAEKGVNVETLLVDVTESIVREHDAEMRFRKRAELGAGRDSEALALLSRK